MRDAPRYEKINVIELKELDESLEDQQSGIAIMLEDSLELKLLNESKVKEALSETSRYWIQYLNYVKILKLYIRAERTTNWELHLESIRTMIYIFAAGGHINYANC